MEAPKKLTGFIITAGHLDIEWYQPMRSYRFWTIESIEDLKEASKRKDFVCYVLDGQVFPLEGYLEVFPQDESQLRQFIKEGKLAIGPFYTQFDEWLPSAENIIRNLLYGKRKAEDFGAYMRAGYLPDNFGHPFQLPQILRGFGIDSLLFMRGMPEIPGGHPDEFIYKGLDGSEVLASHFRESYSGAFDIFNKKIDPIQPRIVPYYDDYLSFEWHREMADHDDPQRIAKSMVSNVHNIKDRYPSGIIPLIAGSDHLPPQINIGDSVKAANESQDEINFVMGTVEEYVKTVYEHIKNPAVYNMELIGSRYHYILLGALSTRTYLKRQNFACEALMERYVEPLDAIAAPGGYPDKKSLFDEAWKYLMINSAHDSIHGSSVDEVHKEMEFRNAAVRQIASGLIHDILSYCSRRIDHWWERLPKEKHSMTTGLNVINSPGSGKGILTYAPVDAEFDQPVELWLPIGDLPAVITDPGGHRLATQILPREKAERNGLGQARNDIHPSPVYRKVLFLAKVGPRRLNSYAVIHDTQRTETADLKTGDRFIENDLLKVEVNGSLINLYNKKTDQWYYNLNLLEEEADAGDAWDFSPPWTPGEIIESAGTAFTSRVVEGGPVRAMLIMEGTLNVPAELEGDSRSVRRTDIPIKFFISLYAGIGRVDVRLEMINTAKDHRIRLKLLSNIKADFIRSQGQLAIIDRPIERQKEIESWRQPPTQLLPFREWLSFQDNKNGFCLAVKGLYDYEARMNQLIGCPEISVTLVRGFDVMSRINMMQRKGAASHGFVTPEAQCPGPQTIEWSYIPYAVNSDDKAPFISLAQSFLYPPVSHAVRAKQIDTSMEKAGGIVWDKPNIQFSAYKRCYNRDGYIVRLFENQGKETDVKIFVNGFNKAWLTNLNEETGEELNIDNSSISLRVRPYKIISLKLS
jgi:mannosylglycerate hydrolase